MKIGMAIIIALLAVVALVAEVVLYFVLGMGAAFAGGQAAVGGIAVFFVGLMIVTAAAALLAPVGAVIEMLTKRTNLGAWILVGGLSVVAVGYIGVATIGYLIGGHRAIDATAAITQMNSTATAGSPPKAPPPNAASMFEVKLLKKALIKQDYQDFVFFDVEWRATGLKRASRAVKGVLQFQDLFGEPKMRLNWTIDKPLAPGDVYVEKGSGFKYNMFMNDHQWVNSTALENMKAVFVATNIIYQDGTTEEIRRP